eukprot:m.225710 g.225710  ORF g.225710 m.225710 type:complete len:163 (+) comp35564_c0_seq1:136-624(+)
MPGRDTDTDNSQRDKHAAHASSVNGDGNSTHEGAAAATGGGVHTTPLPPRPRHAPLTVNLAALQDLGPRRKCPPVKSEQRKWLKEQAQAPTALHDRVAVALTRTRTTPGRAATSVTVPPHPLPDAPLPPQGNTRVADATGARVNVDMLHRVGMHQPGDWEAG